MNKSYSVISGIYDKINSSINYDLWSSQIEAAFDAFLPKRPEIVLDLACGTGSMSHALAKRGYDMIALDLSEDMLSVAAEKTAAERKKTEKTGKTLPDILYICRNMTDFELYGTVGAVVCCLDSLNYLTENGELEKCFSLVHNYLDPDGLFLFDLNTPYKFENVYGKNSYVYEFSSRGRGSFCVWQNYYNKRKKLCDFYLSCFEEESDGRYTRRDECQRERCFTKREIAAALEVSGFELLGIYGSADRSEAADDCERWYIAARCRKP